MKQKVATGAVLLAASLRLVGAEASAPGGRWTNSLGQVFAPVPGTNALACVWETRVKDFQLFVAESRHDATNGAWALYKERWRQGPFSWSAPGFGQTGDHPVCGVSWLDARAFCAWLTGREREAGHIGSNQTYRLPYDAEWSRLAGDSKYPGGGEWNARTAAAGNYAGQEARDEHWYPVYPVVTNHTDRFPRTAPVGSFPANAAGLHDLGGNVWEWCEDTFRTALVPEDILKADPTLANRGRYRVLRGSSWREGGPLETRLDYRRPMGADHRYTDIGFRCVLELPSPAPASAPTGQ
jgi:formylglycine-generating enzyme required for sulfatase activity